MKVWNLLRINFITSFIYQVGCLGQETAKKPFGLRVKLSPVYDTRKCNYNYLRLSFLLQPFIELLFVVVHIYPSATGQRQTLTVGRSTHFSLWWLLRAWWNPYVLNDFLRFNVPGISSKIFVQWPLNLLLLRSHQAEIITVKRLIQGRSNMTMVQVEPRSAIRVVVKAAPWSFRPRFRSWKWKYCWYFKNWTSSKAFVSGAGGLRFKSRAGQIRQCCQRFAIAVLFLPKKLCCPRAQWRGDGPRKLVTR